MKIIFIFLSLLFSSIFSWSQGLKNILVEKHHVSTKKDLGDSLSGILPIGSVVYRVYVDMKPGYKLQALYGVTNHELRFETSTKFFNNKKSGAVTGSMIEQRYLNQSNYAFDSWLSMGPASDSHVGVLKKNDKDGSVIKKRKFLFRDGLIKGSLPKHLIYGDLNLSVLGQSDTTSLISTKNGSLAVMGGVDHNINGNNTILVAQLTTDGIFSFEINLQLGSPTGEVEQYVAKNPEGFEIKFDALSFKNKP